MLKRLNVYLGRKSIRREITVREPKRRNGIGTKLESKVYMPVYGRLITILITEYEVHEV